MNLYCPWRHIVIRIDGELKPCCNIIYEKVNLGNVFNNQFNEVWNSERLQKFGEVFCGNHLVVANCAHFIISRIVE
jgi:radical SAM protein with 4Fe4S-binding SPASM domain